MIGISSNYWFGFITQNQLFTWGPLFGIGFDLNYGSNSFKNLQVAQGLTADLTTYAFDINFVKLALLHDESVSNYLALEGHYVSYSNSLSGGSPLNGLGLGIDSQINLFDTVDSYFKLNYIPVARSTRINDAWGANSELGFKWLVFKNAAINFGYKAMYYTGSASGSANVPNSEGEAVSVNLDIELEDLFHGLFIGGEFAF